MRDVRPKKATMSTSTHISSNQERYFSTLRRRLTLWYLCAILLVIATLTIWFYNTTHTNLVNQLDSTLKAHVDIVSHDVYYALPNSSSDPPAHIDTSSYVSDDSTHFTDYPVYITDANWRVINLRGRDLPAGTPRPATFVQPDSSSVESVRGSGNPLMVRQGSMDLYMAPLYDESTPVKIVGWIIAEGPLQTIEGQAHWLLFQLVAGGAALLLISLGGGWLLAGQAIRPLRTVQELQRNFIDDAAHQLATPLTVIQARVELSLQADLENETTIRKGSGQPALRGSLLEVLDETQRLHRLARELLTLARSQLEIREELLALNEVLDEIYLQVKPLAQTKGLEIQREFPVELVTVRGDFERLQELFLILTDNAIKYTPRGGSVTLALTTNRTQAQVHVRDTGIGILSEDLPYIFERFYRAQSSKTTDARGYGLGLAIARQLAQVHHGSLAVQSVAGQGTTMIVTLPLVRF